MNDTMQRCRALRSLAHIALMLRLVPVRRARQRAEIRHAVARSTTLNALLQPNYSWWTNIACHRAPRSSAATSSRVVVGVALALRRSAGRRRWSRSSCRCWCRLNMIPKVALGPLIIVWFSYGIVPEHADGVLDLRISDPADHGARPARKSSPSCSTSCARCKRSRWQLFTKIQLPGALPYIFSGMKVARDPRGRGRDRRRVPRLRHAASAT